MWSITVNDLAEIDTAAVKEAAREVTSIHPEYEHDLLLALELARRAGLASATLTGVRAPNPYANDEVVDISIRGMVESKDFITSMTEVVSNGPEDKSLSVMHEWAIELMREKPCAHDFRTTEIPCEIGGDCNSVCTNCGLHLYRGLLHLQPE